MPVMPTTSGITCTIKNQAMTVHCFQAELHVGTCKFCHGGGAIQVIVFYLDNKYMDMTKVEMAVMRDVSEDE
jgi:hypothetical protein